MIARQHAAVEVPDRERRALVLAGGGIIGMFYDHFPALPRPLYVTGVDIDTAERLVFGEDELAEVHVCRAVAASCAILILFQPIRVGDRDVVDGAVAGAPPIDVAAERGARHIVHVNPLVPIRNDRGKVCFAMFLHHAMSFDARRELLDYGYACGQRTAPGAPPSPSAQRGFLP